MNQQDPKRLSNIVQVEFGREGRKGAQFLSRIDLSTPWVLRLIAVITILILSMLVL